MTVIVPPKTADSVAFSEPRVYFGFVPLRPNEITTHDSEVFLLGEKHPVVFTRFLFHFRANEEGAIPPIERLQNVRVRIHASGQEYTSREFLSLAIWQNQPNMTASPVSSSSVSMHFDRPVYLNRRDQLFVEAQFEPGFLTELPRTVDALFHGFGVETNRPYYIGDSLTISDLTPASILCRNDGVESVMIVSLSITVGPRVPSYTTGGAAHLLRAQVKGLVNGTQQIWFKGPVDPTLNDRCPLPLLGVCVGPAIVHELDRTPRGLRSGAVGGVRMQPGENFRFEVYTEDSTLDGFDLGISAFGYLEVV